MRYGSKNSNRVIKGKLKLAFVYNPTLFRLENVLVETICN